MRREPDVSVPAAFGGENTEGLPEDCDGAWTATIARLCEIQHDSLLENSSKLTFQIFRLNSCPFLLPHELDLVQFKHFKQKELVQWQGRQLKGTDYGINDQYPLEFTCRRKQLFSICKQMIKDSTRAIISVDK